MLAWTRWPWLPRDDVQQCCALARLRSVPVAVEVERLAHELGWRRIVETVEGRRRRRWVPEFVWLGLIISTGRRVGARPGNRNAAGHEGRNQYTREQ